MEISEARELRLQEMSEQLYWRFFVRIYFFVGRSDTRRYRYEGRPHTSCGKTTRCYKRYHGEVMVGLLGGRSNKLESYLGGFGHRCCGASQLRQGERLGINFMVNRGKFVKVRGNFRLIGERYKKFTWENRYSLTYDQFEEIGKLALAEPVEEQPRE